MPEVRGPLGPRPGDRRLSGDPEGSIQKYSKLKLTGS